MKEIKAIIRVHQLDAVLNALHTHPELPGVTVSTVRGFGRTVGRNETGSNVPVQYGTVEMIKLECVVNDEDVDDIVDMMRQASHTGNVGDGKICVYTVELMVKIRTGIRLGRAE